ncbi:energy transducer TonB [Mucilaginibacter sp. ZT4R22]|uniref:Energy transducer TonB n=1 Tax=Mucilaginibacter pankratovii TaxID=2772110 RepID=A0ABR7WU98_9SPHI|nr:energy transducer TonB [Mucilaginibacter pankratovii]MBD1365860.1 energy transducer TonB [Mucilaginibacter pankratovii]
MKALLTFTVLIIVAVANAQPKQPKINVKDTIVYTAVEQQPQFGNDEVAFNKYLMKNVRYVPPDGVGHNTEGRFIASFVVEKDGTISHIKILRNWDSATGKEFVKAIQRSPKWRPGIQNGYLVRTKFSISMFICLASEE